MVRLKGVFKTTAKGRAYYYAWKGGPRLKGLPGSPEFINSYHEAHAEKKAPDPDRFRSVITAYRKDRLPKLSETTRKNWTPWLDRIQAHYGDLRTAQFDRTEVMRREIRAWRAKYADKPRTADYGMQVLSAVLAYAVDPLNKISRNPCEGIKQLYSADRSEIIWTDADMERLKAACSPEIGWAVDLAAHTGLRQGDLLGLSWNHITDNAIIIRTSKSRGKREAIIPLYDALQDVLDRIPRRCPTILTSSDGTPWSKGGFTSSFNKAKKAAKMHSQDGIDLHFNDLRGTAATKLYVANFEIRVIAETLAWDEDSVKSIIKRYVGRNAATLAFIQKMNEANQ